MITLRHRFIFWLIIAYLKKWGKSIFLYFVVGLLVFFVLRLFLDSFVGKIRMLQTTRIGVVGAYVPEDLPPEVLYKISRGLTTISRDGTVNPDIASKWEIQNDRKTYVFYLRRNIYFSDGKELTSDDVSYNFADVFVEKPDNYTIVYTLKDSYSPFLITVSKPIFKKGLIGISDYRIKKIKLNGNFVEYIDLMSKDRDRVIYQFYPTAHAVKLAFLLGEVSKIIDLPGVNFKNKTFYSFPNAKVDKKVNYKHLATLFYNTKDKVLSSKALREALSYTIPDSFDEGERNFGPLPPFSFASNRAVVLRRQDLIHAKGLLDKARDSGEIPEKFSLTIDSLTKYKTVAEKITSVWKEFDIDVNIKLVDKVPEDFQIFLGEFNLPLDVDQYTLWHSDQPTNITRYTNLRVDKLLEDGRKEVDFEKRKKIYADFQKYIAADPPASFLFFPYTYDVIRR